MNDAVGPMRATNAGRGPVLITGGAGFLGSNLADRLASEGHEVVVLDSLVRPGVEGDLARLQERHPHRIRAITADIRDGRAVAEAVREARVVFHFAAQVSVTASLADPISDFTVNVGGTLILLEALRARGDGTPLIFAGTDKVYGDLADIALESTPEAHLPADLDLRAAGIAETHPLSFRTPFGCSKGAADQYVLDYARSFGVPACVLRMGCICGARETGGEDRGRIAQFMARAMAGEGITIHGDGRRVRDMLDVEDALEAFCAAWRNIDGVTGRAFNLGGGPANAVSLRQIVAFIERLYGRPVPCDHADRRPGEPLWFVSDPREIRQALALPAPKPWQAGLRALAIRLATERLARHERERVAEAVS